MFNLALMGLGMGMSISPFLIAVQSSVNKRDLGTATSTLQFSRSIGGTLGVSVMGVVLSTRLAAALTASGLDPNTISINSLLEPLPGESTAALTDMLRPALAVSIQGIFFIAFVAAALGLVITLLAPGGRIAQLAAQNQQGDSANPTVAH
jgi:hypothetical protein